MSLRRLVCAVALLLAAAASPTAVAAPGDRLPTVDQAAGIFPYLAGGQRTVSDPGPLGLYDTQDCMTYEPLAASAHQERAAYLMADGSHPDATGLVAPYATLYRFRTEHRAVKVIREVAAYARACDGPNNSPLINEIITPLPSPGIADRSVAYEWGLVSFTFTGPHIVQRIRVFVQRDHRIVEVVLSCAGDAPPPELAPALRLTRQTLRTSA